MQKSKTLKNILNSESPSFLMEAHDALSARIVEEAHFEGVWASSLSISSAQGMRDASELSSTEMLRVFEQMADATTIPILVDADSGYGNFNNFRLAVKKLSQYGIAGACIEDKRYPKMNSFTRGATILADPEDVCGKIKAARDIQTNGDFVIVARTESFIANRGLSEALTRAEKYREAGADAVLIHSKRRDAEEVLEFAREWADRSPLVVVPTTYYATPVSAFAAAKIWNVIWANHNLRASVTAMRNICRDIRQQQSVANVESCITSISELFEMLDYDELEEAESRYLSKGE